VEQEDWVANEETDVVVEKIQGNYIKLAGTTTTTIITVISELS